MVELAMNATQSGTLQINNNFYSHTKEILGQENNTV